MNPSRALWTFAALGLLFTTQARAKETAPPHVLALVIGSNQTADGALPDLRYADDDAVRYGELLRSLSPQAQVEVLTRLDEDTVRRHCALSPATSTAPCGVTGAPERASVFAAMERLAGLRQQWRGPSVLYLVFAGHGEADAREAGLLLEDGELSRADLARIASTVGAERTHILLDACNSFFVVQGRRPGGRVFTTSTDRLVPLAPPHTDAGVFLSTSAEAQVFEWSQLQGGIFSHAVRSGLRGAADVDGDGLITYLELFAFVRRATEALPNDDYAPRVFFRAPATSPVLVDLRASTDRRLRLQGFSGKVTIRDERGVRLLDVAPEPDFAPTVLLPRDQPLEVLNEANVDGHRVLRTLEVPAADAGDIAEVRAASLSSSQTVPRGMAALFSALFEPAWGPRSFAQVLTRPAPVEVYGLSRAQEQRLLLQLRALRDDAARNRAMGLGIDLSVGLTGVVAGSALQLASMQNGVVGWRTESLSLLAAGGFGLLMAVPLLFPSQFENDVEVIDLLATTSTRERQAKVAETVRLISARADAAESARMWMGGIAVATAVLSAGVGTLAFALDPQSEVYGIGFYGLAGAASGAAVTAFLSDTPAEQVRRLVDEDPESPR